MIKEAIVKLVNKGDLTYEEAYGVMNEIMSGETTPHSKRRLFSGDVHEERSRRND